MGKNTTSAFAKTLRTVLCSFQVVLYLTSIVSSHVFTDQFSTEYLSGRFLLTFSSLVFCPTNSTCLDLPQTDSIQEDHCALSLPALQLGNFPGSETEQSRSLPCLFPISQGSFSFAVQCPKSRKPLFCVFCLPFKLFQAGG